MSRQRSPRQTTSVYFGIALALCVFGPGASGEDFQGSTHKLDYDSEPILYSKSNPDDPVSRIQKRLKEDRTKGWVKFDPKFGYLPAVLDMLHVPASSQMLVFSKTSLQRHQIHPDNARALYFSDDVYVGYVPGAPVLEIAAVDPNLGAVFFTVNQDKDEPVRFRRDTDCLSCHGAARSMGVPGFVLRSLDTEVNGEPVSGTESHSVNHFTPIAERWGGWYVTGYPQDWPHRGNRPGGETETGEAVFQKRVKAENYYAKGSDTLPLLVHDHQTHMHNYFTRIGFEARQNMEMYGHVRYLRNQVDALLRYLLFVEEVPLPSALPPNNEFVTAFQKGAHKDHLGRSLRDFDLQTRIFKYPCSFLIESDGFQKMPEIIRSHIMKKLWEILTGQNQDPAYASLSPESRQATLEILRDILPNLPDYWKEDGPNPTPQ
ncbi:MAG: hypothetical protein WCO60_01390 [Verrucomicrobiota bacterium]